MLENLSEGIAVGDRIKTNALEPSLQTELTTKQHEDEYSFLERIQFDRILNTEPTGPYSPEHTVSEEQKKLIQVAIEAFHRQEKFNEKESNDTQQNLPSYELRCLDEAEADNMAHHLQEAYKSFHQIFGQEFKVMRVDEQNVQFNLLEMTFKELKERTPNWARINVLSAKQFLMIFEVFGTELANKGVITDIDSLLRNHEVLFAMNAALYDVWSAHSKVKKAESGKEPNPLFTLDSYETFQVIANGGEPTEGWGAFTSAYKKFLKDNKDTYAQMMRKKKLIQGNQGLPSSETTGNPDGYPDLITGSIQQSLDINKDDQLSDEEIDSMSSERIKNLIRSQARLELFKDKAMLQYILNNSDTAQELLGAT